MAWDILRDKLLAHPDSVDIVSGATYSSKAIMDAYKDAYSKATAPRYSITLNKTSAAVLGGKTVTLKATLSPADAADRGIKTGDRVLVYNQFGEVEITAYVSSKLLPGTVSIGHG
jgi:anaerobic selenocysteine-containing dehydrogenase